MSVGGRVGGGRERGKGRGGRGEGGRARRRGERDEGGRVGGAHGAGVLWRVCVVGKGPGIKCDCLLELCSRHLQHVHCSPSSQSVSPGDVRCTGEDMCSCGCGTGPGMLDTCCCSGTSAKAELPTLRPCQPAVARALVRAPVLCSAPATSSTSAAPHQVNQSAQGTCGVRGRTCAGRGLVRGSVGVAHGAGVRQRVCVVGTGSGAVCSVRHGGRE